MTCTTIAWILTKQYCWYVDILLDLVDEICKAKATHKLITKAVIRFFLWISNQVHTVRASFTGTVFWNTCVSYGMVWYAFLHLRKQNCMPHVMASFHNGIEIIHILTLVVTLITEVLSITVSDEWWYGEKIPYMYTMILKVEISQSYAVTLSLISCFSTFYCIIKNCYMPIVWPLLNLLMIL